MKKTKLDSQKIKEFFLQHGEKIVFAGFVVVFLNFCYSAYSTKPYEKVKADEFVKNVATVREQVENASWNSQVAKQLDVLIPEPPFKVEYVAKSQPIDPEKFRLGVSFNEPIQDKKVRRGEPTYLPLRELRVASGHGAVQLKDGGAISGQQWVVLTGLVPQAAQEEEYRKSFENAVWPDPELDHPHWANFEVQRAEVVPGMSEDQLPWVKLNKDELIAQTQEHFAEMKPMVEDRFIDPAVTTPVFPLISHTFGDEVVHPPEIPLPPVPLEGMPTSPPMGEETIETPHTPYKLFRFFDHTVETGKTYRYRVMLILKNPNEGVAPQYLELDKPNLADGLYRPLEPLWSAPSPPVKIPGEYKILGGKIEKASTSAEPKASVWILKWDKPNASEILAKFGEKSDDYMRRAAGEIMRGAWLDFPVADVSWTDPLGVARNAQVNFKTGVVLVDVTGGERPLNSAYSRYPSPADMIFMGNNGEMFIRTELEATAAANRFLARHANEEPAEGNPLQPDAPPPPGGRSIFDLK